MRATALILVAVLVAVVASVAIDASASPSAEPQQRITTLAAQVRALQRQMQALQKVSRAQAGFNVLTLDRLSLVENEVDALESKTPTVTTGVSGFASMGPREYGTASSSCLLSKAIGGSFRGSLTSVYPLETSLDPLLGTYRVTAFNQSSSQGASLTVQAICLR